MSEIDADSAEVELRRELALCYRLIDLFRWTEMIFNYVSVRLPGTERRYLVNPFGLNSMRSRRTIF